MLLHNIIDCILLVLVIVLEIVVLDNINALSK